MLELWPEVKTFYDGVDPLDAATLNTPINQLAARTEYLLRALRASANRSNMAIYDAALDTSGGTPSLGQPVYRVPGGNAYALASAIVGDVGENKWFWADNQAMAVGVVGSVPSGGKATVVLGGYIAFGAGIPAGTVIADESPSSGRYFLSAELGKLTAAPAGPIIYVCDCEIRDGNVISMLVNPQYRDTGESHIHRAFVLSGKPVGGYSVKPSGVADSENRYWAPGIVHAGASKSPVSLPAGVTVIPYGHWAYDGSVTYYLRIVRKASAAEASTNWADYSLDWQSGGMDGSDTCDITVADGMSQLLTVGSHGLSVQFVVPDGITPDSLVGKRWDVAMPDAAQAWINYVVDGTAVGYRLNLGMYPEMARFVPPLPLNAAELTADGVELRGAEFGDRRRWEIQPEDESGSGPWLVWYGGEVSGVSYTAPFVWANTGAAQAERDIVLHVNRMRVGPTGFVTSLQAAPGSPLKVTSAQTGAKAFQGALQVGLNIDFKSTNGNAEGHEVVKRIEGSTFITGPVVERVVAGPGMTVDHQQGTVTVSASNAVYAGDFETIALKNAKQDLAGGVFPYTKLLGWRSGAVTNIASGFTAKFRVPDHIPYNAGKGYYVVISASVFGEDASDADRSAAFSLSGYVLADRACSAEAVSTEFDSSIAAVTPISTASVNVPFKAGYSAFDPILLHGFKNTAEAGLGELVLPDIDNQRARSVALCLGPSDTVHTVVYPGYFVGISVERCGVTGTATPYEGALGFLSLRWNLVAVA